MNSNNSESGGADAIDNAEIRLQVFLSRYGEWSRRKAADVIEAGRVSVNGVTILEPFFRVHENDLVKIDNKPLKAQKQLKTWALNKPVGYLCSSSDPQNRPLAISLIPHQGERIYNVGRLDFNSCGLILVTNNGELAQKVMHPSHEVEKEYEVELTEKIDEELLKKFKKGFSIERISYRIRAYRIINERTVRLSLNEGKNREIRRFFEYHHIGIKKLMRIRIGKLHLGSLKSGESRLLTEEEIRSVFS